MDRILITPRSLRQAQGPHREIIREAGYETVESSCDRPLTAAEMAALIPGVAGVVLGLDAFTAEVFDRATRLQAVSRYGVGTDNVDLEAATAHGVVVTNTPGANTVAVAELAMALMLALARRIPYHDRVVRQGGWTPATGFELRDSTLGLIGMGRIGREVARQAFGFGMRLLYHDPVAPPAALVRALNASPRDLDALLSDSDVVSLHLPLTEATRHLIDGRALARMKASACLVNTARGGLVDEDALCEALRGGRLGGAACDVFAHEPPGDHPLLGLDNFIATPHAGSATRQTAARMGRTAVQNLLAVLRGERPPHVVNPKVYARLARTHEER